MGKGVNGPGDFLLNLLNGAGEPGKVRGFAVLLHPEAIQQLDKKRGKIPLPVADDAQIVRLSRLYGPRALLILLRRLVGKKHRAVVPAKHSGLLISLGSKPIIGKDVIPDKAVAALVQPGFQQIVAALVSGGTRGARAGNPGPDKLNQSDVPAVLYPLAPADQLERSAAVPAVPQIFAQLMYIRGGEGDILHKDGLLPVEGDADLLHQPLSLHPLGDLDDPNRHLRPLFGLLKAVFQFLPLSFTSLPILLLVLQPEKVLCRRSDGLGAVDHREIGQAVRPDLPQDNLIGTGQNGGGAVR